MKKFAFIGVTTKASAVNTLFPAWVKALGVSAQLKTIDLPLSSDSCTYRKVLLDLKADEEVVGALITTHKARIFEPATTVLDELTSHAAQLQEIGLFTRRADGTLIGDAPDVTAVAQALKHILADASRVSCNKAMILGAGGAGVALAAALLNDKRKSWDIILTEIDRQRVNKVNRMFAGAVASGQIRLVLRCDPDRTADLIEEQPEGVLIVNATGMGKDRAGSPARGNVRFPRRAIVWDLNYRGALQFLETARSQVGEQHLNVVDGWYCFVCGWSYVLSVTFSLNWDAGTVSEFMGIASSSIR